MMETILKVRNEKWWLEYCLRCIHTGSRVICNPPVLDTDDDYLLLVDISLAGKLTTDLLKDGYKIGGSMAKVQLLKEYPTIEDVDRDDGVFQSFKKDNTNVIVTASEEYFENFVKATFLCKRLNLFKKQDRIEVFQSICCDSWTVYPTLMEKGSPEGL